MHELSLMEAVRVSRAGFPVRILHNDFISRYALLTVRLSSQAGMRDTHADVC